MVGYSVSCIFWATILRLHVIFGWSLLKQCALLYCLIIHFSLNDLQKKNVLTVWIGKIYVTGSAKTRHNNALLDSIFIIYIPNCMCWQSFSFVFKVTALKSSSIRMIDLYSKYRKINYRCLLKQMKLTNGVIESLKIYTIMFAMNWGIDYWVNYSFYCPESLQTQLKSIRKHRS